MTDKELRKQLRAVKKARKAKYEGLRAQTSPSLSSVLTSPWLSAAIAGGLLGRSGYRAALSRPTKGAWKHITKAIKNAKLDRHSSPEQIAKVIGLSTAAGGAGGGLLLGKGLKNLYASSLVNRTKRGKLSKFEQRKISNM